MSERHEAQADFTIPNGSITPTQTSEIPPEWKAVMRATLVPTAGTIIHYQPSVEPTAQFYNAENQAIGAVFFLAPDGNQFTGTAMTLPSSPAYFKVTAREITQQGQEVRYPPT